MCGGCYREGADTLRARSPLRSEASIHSVAAPHHWTMFLVLVAGLLVFDLGVAQRRPHAPRFREAAAWSAFWVALSLAFNGWVAWRFGTRAGLQFLTGYLLEYSLSVDNIFVFLVVFRFFAVPAPYQHRVLFWGVAGAIGLRAAFILAGTALIHRFHWMLYLFGAFLIATGLKLARHDQPQVHPEQNPVVRIFRRFFPIASTYHEQHFTVREAGRRLFTPLALVLLVVETTDVLFALDSIPAIFGVTTDPYLAFTSNILAVLGLRALYFLLRDLMDRFRYLSIGLGAVLVFIGVKMLVEPWWEIPIGLSLAVVCSLIGAAVLVSWLRPARAPEVE
jgi:tellurite resistance protein TerC